MIQSPHVAVHPLRRELLALLTGPQVQGESRTPAFGGLQRVVCVSGEVFWLCHKHAKQLGQQKLNG